MRVSLQWAVWLSCVVACGSSSTTAPAESNSGPRPRVAASPEIDASNDEGAVTVEGTLGGRPFSARGAIATFESVGDPGIPSFVAVGFPETYDTTCAQLKSEDTSGPVIQHASQAGLLLTVGTGGPPVQPATYDVAPPGAGGARGAVAMTASALYEQLDVDCSNPSMETSTSGTVTVRAIDLGSVSGSFDVTFPNGDSVRGQFFAPVCVLAVHTDIMPPRHVCLP